MGIMRKLKSAALAAALTAAGGGAWAQGAGGGLKNGYRAVTLPVAQHQLAFIKAGGRVDVLVTFEAILPKGTREMVTATILQNVLVLAVGVVGAEGAVQLALNPNEAQYAALAVDPKKSLWLIARAPGDEEMHPMEMASFRKLFR